MSVLHLELGRSREQIGSRLHLPERVGGRGRLNRRDDGGLRRAREAAVHEQARVEFVHQLLRRIGRDCQRSGIQIDRGARARR